MSISTDSPARGDAGSTIRRRVAAEAVASASDTARRDSSASPSISTSGSGGERINRFLDTSGTQTSGAPTTGLSTGGTATPSSSGGATMSRGEFRRLLRENFDTVVELLEDRIVADLERRGGRYRRDF